MDCENENQVPTDERILAWLEGELEPEDAETFERRLSEDAGLEARVRQTREALAAAREWLAEEPPGAERVESLAIPPVGGEARVLAAGEPRRVPAWMPVITRALAAAAIFIIGFLAGQFNPRSLGPRTSPSATPAPPNMLIPSSASPSATQSLQATAERTRASAVPGHAIDNPPPAIRHPQPPSPPPVTSARDENGRVVIETTLAGSGGQALWVVDGGFQVASAGAPATVR